MKMKSRNSLSQALAALTFAGVAAFGIGVSSFEAKATDRPDLGGREVRVAVQNTYIPFSFIDLKTGQATGFDYDYYRALCGVINCNATFHQQPYDGMIQAVAAGLYDIAGAGIVFTPEREKIVDFSKPYGVLEFQLLVRADEDRFNTPEELSANTDLAMGGPPGSVNYTEAVKLVGNERAIGFEEWGFAIQALLVGDIDAVVADQIAGAGYINANPGKLKLMGQTLSSSDLASFVQKGSDILPAVNEGMSILEENGTLDELRAKWFELDGVLKAEQ